MHAWCVFFFDLGGYICNMSCAVMYGIVRASEILFIPDVDVQCSNLFLEQVNYEEFHEINSYLIRHSIPPC